MKTTLRNRLIVSFPHATLAVSATTVIWTNTAGGAWSTAANWGPHPTPGSSHTAVITHDGIYTVTISAGASVAGIMLGGGNGTQGFYLIRSSLEPPP